MAPERSKKIPHSKITAGAPFMNASFPYEELIARKLGELPPLPEMADGIWQRISTELDRDMPTNDDDFSGGDPGPGAGWKGWSWLLLLAGIAVVFIYFLQKKNEPIENRLIPEPVIPIDSAERLQQVPDSAVTIFPTENSGIPVLQKSTNPQVVAPDSATPVQPVLVDSISTGTNKEIAGPTIESPAQPILLPRPDSSTGRKRPSGIKGIGPEDYRIVPPKGKKDST
jgi:hypothetical protein